MPHLETWNPQARKVQRRIWVSHGAKRRIHGDARSTGNGIGFIKRSWWCLWIPRVIHVPIGRVVRFDGLFSGDGLEAARREGAPVEELRP